MYNNDNNSHKYVGTMRHEEHAQSTVAAANIDDLAASVRKLCPRAHARRSRAYAPRLPPDAASQ